jgi:hypothetical protein
MKITHTYASILASTAMVTSVLFAGAAFSQTSPKVSAMPEPARWTQEDVTPSQKFAAAKKELVAAKFEAMNACKTVLSSQHSVCVAEAEMIYSQDLAAAQKRFYPSK